MPPGNRGALLEILNEAGEMELANKVQDSVTPSFTNRLYENNSITPDIKESPVIEKPQGALSDESLTQIAKQKIPEVMPQFMPKLLQGTPSQFPPYEPTPQPIDLLRGPKATLSGMVGTIEGMAGGFEWLTNGRLGQDLANQAREWQKSLQPADPTFLDAVNSGFGSAATFFLPGFGLGFGTAKLASISTKLALWLGSGVSAGLEAMTEAGMVYRNVLEETGEVEKANNAASFTFWLNLPLVAITNKLGIFGEQGSLVAKGLSSMVTESPQETIQEVISRTAEQKPITAGGLATAGGVGAITGPLMGGGTGLAFPQTTITPTEKIEKVTPSPLTPLDIKLPTPPPTPLIEKTIKQGEGITQEAGEILTSLTPQEAKIQVQRGEWDKFVLTGKAKKDGLGIGTEYEVKEPAGDLITVYRAVPKSINKIMPGEYVTASKEYAQNHLDNHIFGRLIENKALTKGGHIIEAVIPKNELGVAAGNELIWLPDLTKRQLKAGEVPQAPTPTATELGLPPEAETQGWYVKKRVSGKGWYGMVRSPEGKWMQFSDEPTKKSATERAKDLYTQISEPKVPQAPAESVGEEVETKVELDKEAISQIKTKEQRQSTDEIKASLNPIPENRPARQSSLAIEERNKIITSEGYFTNAQWLIKPEFAPENLRKVYSKNVAENRPPTEKDVLEPLRSIVKPAKEVASLEEITVFRAIDGTIAGFNTNWINYFRKHIKDFNLKISDYNTGALMYSGNKEAGLIMPKKFGIDVEDLTEYKQAVEEYLGITKQPAVEPAPEQPTGAEGETEFYAGIPVKKLLEPFRWKAKSVDDTINLPEELKFSDPEVEKAYNDAKYETPSIFAKGLNFVIKAKESFQRKYTALDPQQDGVVSNILRVFEANPSISKAETAFILKNLTEGFGKKKMGLYQRYIFLADIVQDIKEGLVGKDPDAPLRFKFKSIEQIQQEFEKYKKILGTNPDVKNAIERRAEFIKALAQKQVDLDLLPESVLGDGNYYHHQVLQYMGEKAYPGLSATDVRLKRKGYQIARGGSELDYNTEYLESEFEVISQSLAQLRTVDTLQRLKQFDITNKLKYQARKQGLERWESLIPDDYTFWQPKKGNVFYPALSISEKVAQEVIEGTSELTEEDLKQIYAVGKKKAQWVIPKRYAETFDELGRFTQEGPLANISAQSLTSWKQWKLLNPLRAAKYMLNNLSGDLDIVIAYDYHILKYIPQAFRELTAFSQALEMSENVKEFFQEGGLESGITIHEIPDISKLGYFKLIAGEKPNLINRYWDTVKGFNNFRENLLRLAAYKHFKQNLIDGKVFYGASRKTEIDAMMSSGQPITSIASKLARELIGDYGNISHSGNWMRRHMVPFYSWMEINMPRYVRIAENLSAENRAGGKSRATGAFVAGRFVKFAFFAGFLYSAVELWNRSAWKVIPGFPSPDELTDWQRKQHHIILGRRDDGSIRTIRFQGALGDALEWFGLQDLVRDVQEIYEGGWETLKEKGKEVALAPIERIVQGSRPLIKTGGEALLGKTLYPDITKPRPIRDPWEHALRLIDANKPYRYIKGLPMRGLRDDIESFIFYISDPGESHYYNVKNYVRDYLDKKGIETPTIEPTKKANALYYYKQALRYGEKEKAQEFWEEYKRLGGTVDGKEQSIRMAHPLYGVKSVPEFKASLTVEQRKEIDEAEKWYRKVYFERTEPKKAQEQPLTLVPTIQ